VKCPAPPYIEAELTEAAEGRAAATSLPARSTIRGELCSKQRPFIQKLAALLFNLHNICNVIHFLIVSATKQRTTPSATRMYSRHHVLAQVPFTVGNNNAIPEL
jgi:hypothetical protein